MVEEGRVPQNCSAFWSPLILPAEHALLMWHGLKVISPANASHTKVSQPEGGASPAHEAEATISSAHEKPNALFYRRKHEEHI